MKRGAQTRSCPLMAPSTDVACRRIAFRGRSWRGCTTRYGIKACHCRHGWCPGVGLVPSDCVADTSRATRIAGLVLYYC
jgi:hypothetical protein